MSLRQIALQLHSERLLPQRGDVWYAAGVMDLLHYNTIEPHIVEKIRG